mmetsp:Transcript_86540/g.242349  ORF Transcript_86540/g.242349 Transcript_86540/m.242349 type:complete len:223 (+) Transcript_86540:1293-1961(+)
MGFCRAALRRRALEGCGCSGEDFGWRHLRLCLAQGRRRDVVVDDFAFFEDLALLGLVFQVRRQGRNRNDYRRRLRQARGACLGIRCDHHAGRLARLGGVDALWRSHCGNPLGWLRRFDGREQLNLFWVTEVFERQHAVAHEQSAEAHVHCVKAFHGHSEGTPKKFPDACPLALALLEVQVLEPQRARAPVQTDSHDGTLKDTPKLGGRWASARAFRIECGEK